MTTQTDSHRLAQGRNPWAYWTYEFLDTSGDHRPRPRWLQRLFPALVADEGASHDTRADSAAA